MLDYTLHCLYNKRMPISPLTKSVNIPNSFLVSQMLVKRNKKAPRDFSKCFIFQRGREDSNPRPFGP